MPSLSLSWHISHTHTHTRCLALGAHRLLMRHNVSPGRRTRNRTVCEVSPSRVSINNFISRLSWIPLYKTLVSPFFITLAWRHGRFPWQLLPGKQTLSSCSVHFREGLRLYVRPGCVIEVDFERASGREGTLKRCVTRSWCSVQSSGCS